MGSAGVTNALERAIALNSANYWNEKSEHYGANEYTAGNTYNDINGEMHMANIMRQNGSEFGTQSENGFTPTGSLGMNNAEQNTFDGNAETAQHNRAQETSTNFGNETQRMQAETARYSAHNPANQNITPFQQAGLGLRGQELELRSDDIRLRQEAKATEKRQTLDAQRLTFQTVLQNIDRLGGSAGIEGQEGYRPAGELNRGFLDAYGGSRYNPMNAGAMLPGSQRRDANSILDQIGSGLTLDQAAKLKGAMSDKDIALITKASTRLNNRNISDAEAIRALAEIREVYSRALAGLDSVPDQHEEDGWIHLGGDKANPNNWRKK